MGSWLDTIIWRNELNIPPLHCIDCIVLCHLQTEMSVTSWSPNFHFSIDWQLMIYTNGVCKPFRLKKMLDCLLRLASFRLFFHFTRPTLSSWMNNEPRRPTANYLHLLNFIYVFLSCSFQSKFEYLHFCLAKSTHHISTINTFLFRNSFFPLPQVQIAWNEKHKFKKKATSSPFIASITYTFW